VDRALANKLINTSNPAKLAALPLPQISDLLVSVMVAIESEKQPPDFDQLNGIGVALARSGHEDADRPVLRWLSEAPSARRLDIVSALLNGLWNSAFRKTPVTLETFDLFGQALQGSHLTDEAAYSAVLALSQLMTPSTSAEVKDNAASMLRAFGKHVYSDPTARRLAQEAIHRALERGGFDRSPP